MSIKLRRGVVAAATSFALATTAVPVAMAEDGSSQTDSDSSIADAGSEAGDAATGSAIGAANTGSSAALYIAGIAVSVAFWGTVYNALVKRGTIDGQIIHQLPVL